MKQKNIYLVIALNFFAFAGFAQDTIQGQVIRVDTVKVEKVRVDTVYVQDQEQVQEQTQDQVQESKDSPQKTKNEKVYYGGYANFSFGKYTIIGFEPLIGYKLLPKLSVGGKISYEYYKNKKYDPTREGSNYGISAFSRLRIGRKLYGHVEYSKMNYKLYQNAGENSKRQWISFLYIGGGFSQPITKNTSINAEILWDILQDDDSPYKTVEPIISVGIGVGF